MMLVKLLYPPIRLTALWVFLIHVVLFLGNVLIIHEWTLWSINFIFIIYLFLVVKNLIDSWILISSWFSSWSWLIVMLGITVTLIMIPLGGLFLIFRSYYGAFIFARITENYTLIFNYWLG